MPPEAAPGTPPLPRHKGREFKFINPPHTLGGPGKSHEGVTASNFPGPDGVWTILLLLASSLLPPPIVSNPRFHPLFSPIQPCSPFLPPSPHFLLHLLTSAKTLIW